MIAKPRRSHLAHALCLSWVTSWVAVLGVSSHAIAQTPPANTQPPREDPAMAAARQAYEQLPLADRRALQDNMVWAGIYKGVVDGEFGRMTFNALRTFTGQRPGAADGILSVPDRAALAAEAAKARAAVDFRLVQDARSGITLGIPQKVFVRRTEAGTGARFETTDKSAGVETFSLREGDTNLQALYESYRAPTPGRRVTYSIIRPDFLVVAAETPQRATYTRVARGQAGAAGKAGAAGGEALLRGFTVTWPKTQQARYEMLSVAISNSFDPFGQRAAVASARPGATAASGAGGQAGTPSTPSTPATAGQPTPPKPQLISTAIAFAPNRYVAVVAGGSCGNPRVGTRTARLMRADPVTGLALFDVPGGTGVRLRTPPQKAESGESAVVIFASETDSGQMISAGAGEMADILDPAKPLRLRAPVPAAAAGGLVVSRKGDLLGLLASMPLDTRKNANAPPPASRALIAAATLGEFLAASGLEFLPAQQQPQLVSTGKIAADSRPSVEGLWCLAGNVPR